VRSATVLLLEAGRASVRWNSGAEQNVSRRHRGRSESRLHGEGNPGRHFRRLRNQTRKLANQSLARHRRHRRVDDWRMGFPSRHDAVVSMAFVCAGRAWCRFLPARNFIAARGTSSKSAARTWTRSSRSVRRPRLATARGRCWVARAAIVYFMEAAAIITLISFGHWLEARVSDGASAREIALLNLAPQTARKIVSLERRPRRLQFKSSTSRHSNFRADRRSDVGGYGRNGSSRFRIENRRSGRAAPRRPRAGGRRGGRRRFRRGRGHAHRRIRSGGQKNRQRTFRRHGEFERPARHARDRHRRKPPRWRTSSPPCNAPRPAAPTSSASATA
jgi:hypothetical protein